MQKSMVHLSVLMSSWFKLFLGILIIFYSCKGTDDRINRYELVSRHNVKLTRVDTLGSLSVGNGEFAFTVDVSGLQTFPDEYENGISLGTQSQWAWHSIPSAKKYSLTDVAEYFESCDSTKAPYAVQRKEGTIGEATNYLRANPHRLHLGLIGLVLLRENGTEVELNDLQNIHQQLDLWSGRIESTYTIEGNPVKVILCGDQENDGIAAKIESPLIQKGRLKVRFRFPYGAECHVCAGYDWEHSDRHTSDWAAAENEARITRVVDSTRYYVGVQWNEKGKFSNSEKHQFELTPDLSQSDFEFSVIFSQVENVQSNTYETVLHNNETEWKNFWMSGGAIDFSECTDPRANELERRVVLSQYLTKIQCSGTMPPQETGLTMNSWYGKFHLEMHWWHAAHFALWNRSELLEKSLPWYNSITDKAKATSVWQGYEGARWPKMTDPYGDESPSSVGAFIIWQQPHPIYFADLLYRNNPTKEALNKYKDLVFNTADFMASFVKLKDGKYHLCHPLIPAQEIFKATETDDPAYELQYWYYALNVAQEWTRRLGFEENQKWNEIIHNLAPLTVRDNLYLPNVTTPEAYADDQYRRDHPAVVGAYGFLPYNARVDTTVMLNTFKNIMNDWQWETTWGWDYPLLAMTAARLHQPELAIEALMLDVQKNTYLVNGHNYQDRRLRLYLPGNGGLLAAVAMMAAGWDGNKISNPGFPKNGKWKIKWEGIDPTP
jgi:hypothetical protein